MLRFCRNYVESNVKDFVSYVNLENVQIVKVEKSFENGDQEMLHMVFLNRPICVNDIRKKIDNFLIFKNRKISHVAVEVVREGISFRTVLERNFEGYRLYQSDFDN